MTVTNQPLVSVVVPVYGTASFLPTCLDSLLGQTLADIEIIVINDASPDESQAIIEGYANRDARVKPIMNHENQNLYETRRRGFAAASGLYIATCDSDDHLPLTALEALYKTAQKSDADLVHGQMRQFVAGGGSSICSGEFPFLATNGRSYVLSILRFNRGWSACGKVYHRRIVEKALESLPVGRRIFAIEDLLYAYFFGLAAQKYVRLPEEVYHYRISHGNYFSMPEKCLTHITESFDVLAILKDHLSQSINAEEYEHWLRLFIRKFIADVFMEFPASMDTTLARRIISEKLGPEYLMTIYDGMPPSFLADSLPADIRNASPFQSFSGYGLLPRYSGRFTLSRSGIYEAFILVRKLFSVITIRGWGYAFKKILNLLKIQYLSGQKKLTFK